MGLLTMGGVVEVASMIDSTFVRCDILDRHWPLPPRPADCEFDYSQGISLSAGGPAKFVCAGDTVFGPDDVLPCDEWVTRGSLRCDSAVDGITCHDLSTGHGFFVSRQSYGSSDLRHAWRARDLCLVRSVD